MAPINSNIKPQLTAYEVIFKVLSSYTGIGDFIVHYPFQNKPVNFEVGDITFYDVTTHNLNTRQTFLSPEDETSTEVIVREREFQIDVTKYFDWNDPAHSAGEMARNLLMFISSKTALTEFWKNKIELLWVWDEVLIDGRNDENLRWCEFCTFRFKLLDVGTLTSPDMYINKVKIYAQNLKIEEVVPISQPSEENINE